jgi:hypothetical protein
MFDGTAWKELSEMPGGKDHNVCGVIEAASAGTEVNKKKKKM